MKKTWVVFLIILCGISLPACRIADVTVEVVSERTQLENQVLGAYNSLDTDMLLLASVRGVAPTGEMRPPREKSPAQEEAVTAMQALSFHEDDLLFFKSLGWAGENQEGLLTEFPLIRETDDPALTDFAKTYPEETFHYVVQQINQARMVVMKHMIQMNENLTEADLPEVKQIFGKLNIENASFGERVQGPSGEWMRKKETADGTSG